MESIDVGKVRQYLLDLQDRICEALEAADGSARFAEDNWARGEDAADPLGGGGRTRVMRHGTVFEQAGVNFSYVGGDRLPDAATKARPELAGHSFEAMGVSVVVHPESPRIPTAHMNVRYLCAAPSDSNAESVWWFGGGYDLTPYYPVMEDVLHWHRTARATCELFGEDVYPRLKNWCDEYFYLKHRDETRGVGGLFFDDLNEWGFDKCFRFMRAVGDSFLDAYSPIVERRSNDAWGERERQFQLYRRGRYVEFNLLYDRGTLFGLQSGGRTESILMSLPPLVAWRYDWKPDAGSEEARLYDDFLAPRDWLEQ